MKYVKMIAAAALALLMASSLAACSGDNQGEGLTEVTICLDWTPNTNHTGLYVAAANGYFEEAGLDVSIVQPPEDGATAICAAGQVEFAVTVQDNLAAAFARTDPLGVTAVAALLQHNTSGIISVGEAMLGTIPYWIDRVYKKGHVGVMTRSGSLTNEVTAEIVKGGFGVTTLIGVGGDPVPGTRFAELLPLYEADPDTHAVVIIGELGGTMEEEVAEAMEAKAFTKPLVAFMGGRTAPEGKRMGHAGAIVTGGRGTVKGKTEAIVKAGGKVAKRPSEVGALLKAFLG